MPSLEVMVLATVLGAARAVPVIWLVAPLGGSRVPATVRVGFALLLALLASPLLIAAAGPASLARLSGLGLPVLLAREVAIGLCLGLVASAAFRAAEMAGRLADTLRGANIAEVLVPTSEERSSPLGALYLLLATLIFLQMGGVPRIIEALFESYRALPLTGAFGPTSIHNAALMVGKASARLIVSGLGLAAPIVVSMWLADLALGLIARAAPQVPVYFIGLPLKGLLAIGLVLLGLGALKSAMLGDLVTWFGLLWDTVAALRG